MTDSFSTDLSSLGIGNDSPVVNPPVSQPAETLSDPSMCPRTFIHPDTQVDVNEQITQMAHERAAMNMTQQAPRVVEVVAPVTGKDTFLNYFPFLSAINIDEDAIKKMVLGIVLLMIMQMPQFRTSLLGVVPPLFKSNDYMSNLTVAMAIIVLYVVVRKFMS